MRHSEIDKRARRNSPRQCLSDYGHNVHKDAPSMKTEVGPLPLDMSYRPVRETLDWLRRQVIFSIYGRDFDLL